MSKKYFVLAYLDTNGNVERVAPKSLTISYGDKVIWANNLGENYTAQDFVYQGPGPSPGQLFPANSYSMPPNGQSSSAQAQISQNGTFSYTYNCINGSGESLDPVIIVDNPGTGDGDGNQSTRPAIKAKKAAPKKKAKAQSKKAAPKKSKSKKRR
jgi:plastocyanin